METITDPVHPDSIDPETGRLWGCAVHGPDQADVCEGPLCARYRRLQAHDTLHEGRSGRKPVDPRIELAAALLADGADTYDGVARETRLARRDVCNLAETLGMPSRQARVAAEARALHSPSSPRATYGGAKHAPDTLTVVLELRSTGLGYGTIATQVGMSRSQVHGICRRASA